MSRVGRRPIPVPEGVEVEFAGGEIAARGPLGTLSRSISPDMSIELSNGVLTVSRPTDSKTHRSLHGLTRTLIANMVQGVSEGFQKDLEIVGVGYRAQLSGEKLIFQLGYSHPVEVSAPPGISFSIKGTNKVMVSGIDKELVGKVSAQIRALRPPDHYKGKGVRYSGEQVRLKAGKSGKAKK
ncbi:50S ribosomal protein L6 [Dehalococcoidia bacterium]|nr:50S ribosomal protein L6 [Dehalococcoidia bacterium]MCL0078353.1 50S ribosomal protein L6 [Dehalococcoidia bacterium]MCL0089998.1 50S ribosomal protein L6 [Dehalococcoidia bacterium]